MIVPKYKWSCPNCGGTISADRLEKGLPCSNCLPNIPKDINIKNITKVLASRGKLKGYAWLYQLNIDYEDFERFFLEKTGYRLWSAQRGWARRLLMLESLEIVAPTGVGKTTLLSAYATYMAEKRKWNILYLVPTENLVKQTSERIKSMSSTEKILISYRSSITKNKREEVLKRIENKNFKILVITTGFLQRHFEILKKISPFELIIVDDVDSLLRQSRNIERILMLMGYNKETIETALELVDTKQKLFRSLALGLESKTESLQKRVTELESKLRILAPAPQGQLVIASATGRPKGIRHLVFRELLGFEIGGTTDYMRNVIDSFIITDNVIKEAVNVVHKIGKGGIIFVSQSFGKSLAKILVKKLQDNGIKARTALAGSRKAVELLATGKVDVIVGVASRYGVIVRGLDLPEVIKYAIFVGVPSRKMQLEETLLHPKRLLRTLLYLKDRGIKWASEASKELSKKLEKVPESVLVISAIKGKLKAEGLLKDLAEITKKYSEMAILELKNILDIKKVIKIGTLVLVKENENYYSYIIDAPTYLQASGRTSRLLNGVMTLGLSIVIDKYIENINSLNEKLSWLTKSNFENFYDLHLNKVKKKLEESRKGSGRKVDVKTILLIVESPTKAKTIAWFWGRPSRRRFGRIVAYETSVFDEDENIIYLITTVASRGHIYDLAIDKDDSRFGVEYREGIYEPIYTTIKRCLKCGYQFTDESSHCPRCGSEAILDTKSIIDILRKLAFEVDEVVVATDPDREGEKIGWDIALTIKPYNPQVSRAKFHEVTPHAVLEAIRNRETFNKKIINAQIVRRIEDRWIGFSLSGHIKDLYKKIWLGAGRVQTPVLGWIINKFDEWKKNRGYLILVTLDNGKKLKFFTEEKIKLEEKDILSVKVIDVKNREEILKPLPPFTTDSLLFEAQKILGLPSWITMKLAQELFESGLITYHRTDSIRVSPAGISIAKIYLEKRGLEPLYEGRSWSEDGAHEAIRPTRPLDVEELNRAILEGSLKIPIKLSGFHLKLYDLIFRRFIASQMTQAKVITVSVAFELRGLINNIERPAKILEKGFTEIYDPGIQPWLYELRKGQKFKIESIKIIRASRTRLLTSGDVVRLMRENGIGRPSTYSKIIKSNIRHGYVIVSKKRGYLIPTKMGIEIYNHLTTNFPDIVSVETTRRLENDLDRIEKGKASPLEVLDKVWKYLEKMNLVSEYEISRNENEALA